MVAGTDQIAVHELPDYNQREIDSEYNDSSFTELSKSNGFLLTGIHRHNGICKKQNEIKMVTPEPKLKDDYKGIYPPNYKQLNQEDCSLIVAFLNFLSFSIILLVGYVKEFFFPPSIEEKNRENYVPLYIGFESFYTRNVYRRIQLCFNTPICSTPGAYVTILNRETPDNGWTIRQTDKRVECMNIGSYNYLGFAQNFGPCKEMSVETIKRNGITTSSPRLELGTMQIHNELEDLVAEFLGVEASITLGMGFGTNVLNIPVLFGKNCLVLSDEYNHASLCLGCRLSGATVKVFRHNDCDHLEKILRESLINGLPRTRRPWRKVLIIVEGIYSMEGSICDLPRLIEIKKKYKAYLYLDEAHSIGALGPNGRGVVDYFNCDPTDVDILMGTFTKSFGSSGGYLAGKKELIDYLRVTSHAQIYACSMSPPVAQQVITSMKIIMGKDGTNEGQRRIHQLARNARYLRRKLKQMGFIVYGHDESPVVPLMLFLIPKIYAFVLGLHERGIASVGVGFPATKITGARMRFCLSASHTKEMLDYILEQIDEVGSQVANKHINVSKLEETIEW